MNFLRFLAAAPPGLAITAVLLFAMQALIDSGTATADPGGFPVRPIMLGRVAEPEPTPPEPRPQPIDDPMPPPATLPPGSESGSGTGVYITGPAPGPGTPVFGRIDFGQLTDGPLVHMVRVKPAFPPKALRLGIDGFVTVQFDVSIAGKVVNVMVIESSHTLFEPAAVRAARKFRFKPRVVDGEPVAVSGISYRFRFDFDE